MKNTAIKRTRETYDYAWAVSTAVSALLYDALRMVDEFVADTRDTLHVNYNLSALKQMLCKQEVGKASGHVIMLSKDLKKIFADEDGNEKVEDRLRDLNRLYTRLLLCAALAADAGIGSAIAEGIKRRWHWDRV